MCVCLCLCLWPLVFAKDPQSQRTLLPRASSVHKEQQPHHGDIWQQPDSQMLAQGLSQFIISLPRLLESLPWQILFDPTLESRLRGHRVGREAYIVLLYCIRYSTMHG